MQVPGLEEPAQDRAGMDELFVEANVNQMNTWSGAHRWRLRVDAEACACHVERYWWHGPGGRSQRPL